MEKSAWILFAMEIDANGKGTRAITKWRLSEEFNLNILWCTSPHAHHTPLQIIKAMTWGMFAPFMNVTGQPYTDKLIHQLLMWFKWHFASKFNKHVNQFVVFNSVQGEKRKKPKKLDYRLIDGYGVLGFDSCVSPDFIHLLRNTQRNKFHWNLQLVNTCDEIY